MSHYGSAGEYGPRSPEEYGRQGPEEYGRRGPADYGPPSDPWGAAPVDDPWNDYGLTAPPHSAYSDGGPYAGGSGPPPRRNVGLYGLVAVLVVLAAAAVGYALYLLSGGDPEPIAGGESPAPTTSTGPTGSAGPSGSPRDNIGMNAAMAQVDDCLVNDGTAEQPEMRIVPCDAEGDSQVFQVLAIFSERVAGEGAAANEQAQEICSGTEGYKFHYYEVSETASFVLCMTDA